MELLQYLISFVVCILPIILFCFLTYKINYARSSRARQFFMPIIALVYSVVVLIFLDKINALIISVINFLTENIPFLSGINWTYILVFLSNIILMLGFVIVKAFTLPIIGNTTGRFKTILQYTSGIFYEYDEKLDKWFLKPHYARINTFCKGFYFTAVAVSFVVMFLSCRYGNSAFFSTPFYPVFGIIILGEVVWLLSGITKVDFIEDVLGIDEESYTAVNYGALSEILTGLFGKRVVFASAADSSDSIESLTGALQALAENDSAVCSAVVKHFTTLATDGTEIDPNYVRSCIDLINGKSILFCNPFYTDSTDYIIIPLVNHLMKYHNCLIITGRDSTAVEVKTWISESLYRYSNVDSLWRVDTLASEEKAVDVGIVRFCDLYNLKMLNANDYFLSRVKFVILIEPSWMLSTGQMGLNMIASRFSDDHVPVTYCIFDRNCDGLVDSLSHTLRIDLTDVSASLPSTGSNTQMYWNADGEYMHHKVLPHITRYLGIGSEIGTVAAKYNIPEIDWISSTKFPVIDMKWIIGQYYQDVCKFCNMPISQDLLYEVLHYSSYLWGYKKSKNAFLILEDEFCNLFEQQRLYRSRAKEQSFINVISENYMLRDYMVDNNALFLSDPKAIPSIIADYARTERNVVLKLVMLMLNGRIPEARILREFELAGIVCQESAYATLRELIEKHCFAEALRIHINYCEELDEDGYRSILVKYFSIEENSSNNTLCGAALIRSLKNAYFIAEDEKDDLNYIGARLYGHVFQAYLPSQFLTIDGKYYEIMTITPQNGVVVRRAADHITNRRYYRQIREIEVTSWQDDTVMGAQKNISGIDIIKGLCDFKFKTYGYYDMLSYNDLKTAKKTLLNGIPDRSYKNKSMIKVVLPESEENVRFTVCVLLNELFKTVYPDSYQYISATLPLSDTFESAVSDIVTPIHGECDESAIYIVEDSDIDLGLIVSVDRNIKRFFEIITDYLVWHLKNWNEKEPEEPECVSDDAPVFEEKPRETFIEWLIRILGIKKKKKEEQETPEDSGSDEAPAEDTPVYVEVPQDEVPNSIDEEVPNGQISEYGQSESDDNETAEMKSNFSNMKSRSFRSEASDADDLIDIDGEEDGTVVPNSETEYAKSYRQNAYLLFGSTDIDASIAVESTIEYLSRFGYCLNPLQQTRDSEDIAKHIEETYDPHRSGVHFCDFCGAELVGGNYEVLKDGRERCPECSGSAIRTASAFADIFKTVMRNMESFYGIKYNIAIKVRMANAKKIARHCGITFAPTPGFDGRVLGFARQDKDGYSIYVENGAPKLAASATIAHELTHIWQYLNWDSKKINKKYGERNELEVYEGMAKWIELQYLYYLNETEYAKREEIATRHRDDEYGRGFLKYSERYKLSYSIQHKSVTPFTKFPPL